MFYCIVLSLQESRDSWLPQGMGDGNVLHILVWFFSVSEVEIVVFLAGETIFLNQREFSWRSNKYGNTWNIESRSRKIYTFWKNKTCIIGLIYVSDSRKSNSNFKKPDPILQLLFSYARLSQKKLRSEDFPALWRQLSQNVS